MIFLRKFHSQTEIPMLVTMDNMSSENAAEYSEWFGDVSQEPAASFLRIKQ
jgi:hypothetical protein